MCVYVSESETRDLACSRGGETAGTWRTGYTVYRVRFINGGVAARAETLLSAQPARRDDSGG